MKGRTSHHRPPSSSSAAADPPDDWVDGSWTVDCSCGVNFDDGEEMVICDECGVWVHTRCSRFSKSEASFACHKCTPSSRIAADDETEETEVAQLLAELPNKSAFCPPQPLPRLGLETSLEDRVHVHGIPGGDADLFKGQVSSSVFTPALWRCTGYVPKKFNFQYREFPCWGEAVVEECGEEEEENTASLGADVLFSLSKMPVVQTVWNLKRPRPMDVSQKRDGGKVSFGRRSLVSSKKEENKGVLGFGVNNLKKGKVEEKRKDRDRSLKKKVGVGGVCKFSNNTKKGSVPLGDMNKSDLCGDDALQVADSKTMYSSHQEGRKGSLEKPSFQGDTKKPRNILVVKTSRVESSHEFLMPKGWSMEANAEVVKVERAESERNDEPTENDASDDRSSFFKISPKEEDMLHTGNGSKRPTEESRFEESTTGVAFILPDSESSRCDDSQVRKNHGPISAMIPRITTKDEGDDQIIKLDVLCPVANQNLPGLAGLSLENSHSHGLCKNFSSEPNILDCHKGEGIHDDLVVSEAIKLNNNDQIVQESTRSVVAHDLQATQDVKWSDEFTKERLDAGIAPSACDQVVVTGEIATTSSSDVISGSVSKPVQFLKTRIRMNSGAVGKNDEIGAPTEESMSDVSIIKSKDSKKSIACSESKLSQTSEVLHGSASNHGIPDLKERITSSSKLLDTERTTVINNGDGSSQTQNAPSKPKSTMSYHKNEKLGRSIPLPSPKASGNAAGVHSSASKPSINATALSDEELALLLHQELNSSPRVPRVPRMRQAAIAQFSPTGTSMLSKRSYFSGGIDHVSVSKRKNKEDASRDGTHNSRELNGETSRVRKKPSFSDSDGSFKKVECGRSPEAVTSGKRSVPTDPSSDFNRSLPPLELNGPQASPKLSSTRETVDDDSGVTSRTLPGLIDEIMKKGKCATYEDLCDAVRPHWRTLRKPNGERYAYASHSQAVLDCLRNRNEWSHLIDRGPKTNSNKKRRKSDLDMQTADSETEEVKTSLPRDADDKNDFPKGKRMARKRRRLELRGQSAKNEEPPDQETAPNEDEDDDNEAVSLTNSSNEGAEGLLNEGESEEGDEASGSSSEDAD